MATTRIIPMHSGKGKSIAQSIRDRTDYVKNPDKTQQGEFISAYECDIATIDAEFLLLKNQYHHKTGRRQNRKNDVLAYQIRQAFTPEEANRIGYEFALLWTKQNYPFIVCTHTDKAHIHNHIVYSAVSWDCKRKFRNFWNSTKAVRNLSDRLCLENGLSIVENPKETKCHYGKWLGEKKKQSNREKLKTAIDDTLAQKPSSFEDFLRKMEEAGYEIKHGKHLAFRLNGDKKFIRCRDHSLGEDYTEEAIKERILGKRNSPKQEKKTEDKIDLLIDIQEKIKAGKGAGYEHRAKIFNLKQAAKAAFSALNTKKLPTLKELSKEYEKLLTEKKNLYSDYRKKKKEIQEILTVKSNVDRLLFPPQKEQPERENER
ncbi:relaxase [Clostridiales bacterium COT073_COT-073]|nr:relaxase [Clostridiales bacterium COT073_COT-073]